MASKNKEKNEEKVENHKLSVQEQIRRLNYQRMTSVPNTIRRLSNPDLNQTEERDEFPTDQEMEKSKKVKNRLQWISGQGLRNSMRKMSNSGSRFLKSILPVSKISNLTFLNQLALTPPSAAGARPAALSSLRSLLRGLRPLFSRQGGPLRKKI